MIISNSVKFTEPLEKNSGVLDDVSTASRTEAAGRIMVGVVGPAQCWNDDCAHGVLVLCPQTEWIIRYL